MRVLNLFAGIGGNRKLWPITEQDTVVAVEINPEIAAIYQSFFPKDQVVVGDAHQYLLDHYKEFDFIWTSPPCPSHSITNHFLNAQGVVRYPDMTLYQEIIFLKTFFHGLFCVENVKPYYEPLIKPQEAGRHCFWTNFNIAGWHSLRGPQIGTFNRKSSKLRQNRSEKDRKNRDMVDPELGLHVWNCAFKEKQLVLSSCFDA